MQQLYVEVHGQGPALVLIPGGGGDAGVFADVAPRLGGQRTVITFDRRGNSRSPQATAGVPIDVSAQADDVVVLLDQLGISRAAVFGNSSGAIVALDLVARHANRLTCAVIHEPPAVGVLGPTSPERAAIEDIYRIGREKGVMRAFAAFGAMSMSDPPWLFRTETGRALVAAASRVLLTTGWILRSLTGRQPDTMTRMLNNARLLISRELPAFCFDYEVDLDALGSAAMPWALAVGEESAGRPYDRPARVIAERVGVECVSFPGGHTVYQEDPDAFAERLDGLMKELETCRERD